MLQQGLQSWKAGLWETYEEGRKEKQADERPNAGVKTDFCSVLPFSLCQVTPKLSLFVLTSCEESPPLSSFLPGYLPPPKMLRSIFSEAELLHDLYQSPSGLLLKSYFPDDSPLTTDEVKWSKGSQKIKGAQKQKDKLVASLFNTVCASQGRGAGNRSQHPEITLTAQHHHD